MNTFPFLIVMASLAMLSLNLFPSLARGLVLTLYRPARFVVATCAVLIGVFGSTLMTGPTVEQDDPYAEFERDDLVQ